MFTKNLPFIIVMFIFLSFTRDLYAQTNTGQSQASAIVLWNLNVEGIQNLQFDEITLGEEKIINVDGTVEGNNASGLEQAGKFRITTPQSFSLSFKNLPTEMNGPDGVVLPINFFAAWSDKPFPSQNELNIFDIDSPLSLEGNNGISEIYLFLGARVSPTQSQILGDYSVEVTISIVHGVE